MNKDKFVTKWLRSKVLDLSFDLNMYIIAQHFTYDRNEVLEHNIDFKIREIMGNITRSRISSIDINDFICFNTSNEYSFFHTACGILDCNAKLGYDDMGNVCAGENIVANIHFSANMLRDSVRDIFCDILSGKYTTIYDYVFPTPSEEYEDDFF